VVCEWWRRLTKQCSTVSGSANTYFEAVSKRLRYLDKTRQKLGFISLTVFCRFFCASQAWLWVYRVSDKTVRNIKTQGMHADGRGL
jgi:hypothetical protein